MSYTNRKRYFTEELIDLETGELTTRQRTVAPDVGQLALSERLGWDEWDVPTEKEASRAALDVVEQFYITKPLNDSDTQTGQAAAPKRGRPALQTANPFADYFAELDWHPEGKAFHLPAAVEDALIVACRTSHSNTIFPINQMVRCLRLPVISTGTVLSCINGTREPSQRVGNDYAKRMAKACRDAIERLQSVSLPEVQSCFNLSTDARGYAEYCAAGKPPFTELSNGHVYSEAEKAAIHSVAMESLLR